ncbi:MAG: hypothetical protein Q7K45_00880, partial [Nanoarchaeota archaeon]|nr:hypothetical protein [Nanoarchaeota archaeon]
RARVKRDANALRTGGDGATQELSYFLDKERLDQDEREIIGKITQLGEKHAEDFSKINFAFTPFLDDVPETAWNNLEKDDLDRLLIRDHSEFEKGYGAITKLIANPSAKPEEIIKAFEEAFHGIASPVGIGGTQKIMEPFINAYMRISRLNNWAKYAGTLMKLGRNPRSEAEKYNLQSQIALDEENQSHILDVLAQHEVIADDPTEADEDGHTQLWSMKKKNKIDMLAVVMMQFRIISALLGEVLALELFKAILPPDMAKILG